jgi:hypothetical protein
MPGQQRNDLLETALATRKSGLLLHSRLLLLKNALCEKLAGQRLGPQ